MTGLAQEKENMSCLWKKKEIKSQIIKTGASKARAAPVSVRASCILSSEARLATLTPLLSLYVVPFEAKRKTKKSATPSISGKSTIKSHVFIRLLRIAC